ncbi:SgrR family transcriptional regulator [Pseudomonas graminis]
MMAALGEHFQRLYMLYAAHDVAHLQVDEVAHALSSTPRNARILLSRMRESGWIDWQPQRGRGKRSSLRFLITPQALQQHNLSDLLEHSQFDKALKMVGGSSPKIKDLIRDNFGTFITNDEVQLKIPYYRAIDGLNPLLPQRRTERHLIRQCFSGLTRYDPFQRAVVPDLAHYWLHNDSFTQWQFFLRKNLHFSDGSKINAEEVRRCLEHARHSAQFRGLFADISEISLDGELKLSFLLQRPLENFPGLLSVLAARLFKTRNGQWLCSGPFCISEHSDTVLCLRRNSYYHQSRPMIDEVNVYRFDTQELNMSFITLLHTHQAESINKPTERKLEQGGCFLLIDSEGHCADMHWRRFLNEVLQPLDILRRSQLTPNYSTALAYATGMLPDWNHRIIDYGQPNPSFGNNRPLVLATFEQPELSELARGIVAILQQHGISCQIKQVSWLEFMSGKVEGADLWLSNFMIDFDDIYSALSWMIPDPVLKRLPQEMTQSLHLLIQQYSQHENERFMPAIARWFMRITQQRWLLPLFHHWLDYESDSAFTWRDLSTLGWPDFSQLWIE